MAGDSAKICDWDGETGTETPYRAMICVMALASVAVEVFRADE